MPKKHKPAKGDVYSLSPKELYQVFWIATDIHDTSVVVYRELFGEYQMHVLSEYEFVHTFTYLSSIRRKRRWSYSSTPEPVAPVDPVYPPASPAYYMCPDGHQCHTITELSRYLHKKIKNVNHLPEGVTYVPAKKYGYAGKTYANIRELCEDNAIPYSPRPRKSAYKRMGIVPLS